MTWSFKFKHNQNKYSFIFKAQLNLIIGDSSTGKTAICRFIRRKDYTDFESTNNVVIVSSVKDVQYAENNSILLIDSDDYSRDEILEIKDAVKAIKNNTICVVYLGRNEIKKLPFAVQNTYKLVTAKNTTINVPVCREESLYKPVTLVDKLLSNYLDSRCFTSSSRDAEIQRLVKLAELNHCTVDDIIKDLI